MTRRGRKPNGNVTHAQLAEAFGISRSTVTTLVKRGMPQTSVDDARLWRAANQGLGERVGDQNRAPEGQMDRDLQHELLEARLARERADARLKNARASIVEGESVPVGEACRVISVALAHIAAMADAMPDELCNDANPADPPTARTVMRSWVEDILKPAIQASIENEQSIG